MNKCWNNLYVGNVGTTKAQDHHTNRKAPKTKGRKHESLTANRPRPGAIKNRINKRLKRNAATSCCNLHPRNFTLIPKMMVCKRYLLSNMAFLDIKMLLFEGVFAQKNLPSSSLALPKLDIIKEGSFSPHDIHTSVHRDTLSSSKCVVLSPWKRRTWRVIFDQNRWALATLPPNQNPGNEATKKRSWILYDETPTKKTKNSPKTSELMG